MTGWTDGIHHLQGSNTRESLTIEYLRGTGGVLRCLINDGGFDGETTVIIDDRELSLREFGRLLRTYAGWGMRITFVSEDAIEEDPLVEVQEPKDE